MEKSIKTFGRVARIAALVTAVLASVTSFAMGNVPSGTGWACCALWVTNTMLTQIQLDKIEEKSKNEVHKTL